MRKKLYSVDDISEYLDMHPKTVQRYIREGKIKASKIGKSWKVTEEDFREFTGDNISEKSFDKPGDTVYDSAKVSSVVDISVRDTDSAINIANLLTATMNGKQDDYGKTSLNIQFIEPENKVRVMLWGNVKFMEHMMGFISDYIENKY